MFSNVWAYLNGKKTIVGALITLVAYIVGGLPLLAVFVPAVTLAKWIGIGTTVVGVLHKAYKYIYGVDHP